MSWRVCAAASALLLSGASAPAVAQNFIANPGFETNGGFLTNIAPPWTISNGAFVAAGSARSGATSLAISAQGSVGGTFDGTAQQTFVVPVSGVYAFAFYEQVVNQTGSFAVTATLNGNTVVSATYSNLGTYALVSQNVTLAVGTTSLTVTAVRLVGTATALTLDDFSLTLLQAFALAPVPTDLRSAALTRNQNAVATALTLGGAASPAFAGGTLLAALNGTPVGNLPAAFDALSGEIHADVGRTLLNDAGIVRDAIMGRLRGGGPGFGLGPNGAGTGLASGTYQAGYAADLPGRRRPALEAVAVGPTLDPTVVGIWGEGFGAFGTAHRTRDTNAATLDRTVGGFVAGIDATFEGQSRIGVAGGYSSTQLDLDARASRAEITSGFGALYGATSLWGVALRAGLAGAGHDVDTRRTISFPGFADSARASYGGYTAQAFGEVALPIPLAGPATIWTPSAFLGQALLGGAAAVTLEPFVGGAAIRVGTDRFTEIGGPAALAGFSRERDLGTVTAGLRTETRLGPNGEFLLRSSLGYRGAFGEVDPYARLAFAGAVPSGAGVAFSVLSVPLDRHALVTETRLDWRVSANTTLGLTYAGAYGRHSDDSQVRGRIEYRW